MYPVSFKPFTIFHPILISHSFSLPFPTTNPSPFPLFFLLSSLQEILLPSLYISFPLPFKKFFSLPFIFPSPLPTSIPSLFPSSNPSPFSLYFLPPSLKAFLLPSLYNSFPLPFDRSFSFPSTVNFFAN